MGMEVDFASMFDEYFIQLFKFKDKEAGMPADVTLMRWLWNFGSFCKYKGVWSACRVNRWTVEEKPATVMLYLNLGNTIQNIELLNQGEVSIDDLEGFYSVFPLSIPIRGYISKYVVRERKTYDILDGAITRSLETAIIQTKARFGAKIQRALNDLSKGKWFIIERDNNLSVTGNDLTSVVEIPNTAKLLEPLQNSHDWSHQILLTKLGFSFNPEKRERLIVSELQVQTQEIKANREMLTSLLREQSTQYGHFKVEHIASYYERETMLQDKIVSGRMDVTSDVIDEIYDGSVNV